MSHRDLTRYQIAAVVLYSQGLTLSEVATALGRDYRTVQTWIRRAKLIAAKLTQDQDNDHDPTR